MSCFYELGNVGSVAVQMKVETSMNYAKRRIFTKGGYIFWIIKLKMAKNLTDFGAV